MPATNQSDFRVMSGYQPIFRELGIDQDNIFDHPLIIPWRKLWDRDNCTLDATLQDGRTIRWHVKRYIPRKTSLQPGLREVRGHQRLVDAQIPTMQLVAYGQLAQFRSVVIFEDLAGFTAADKLIESGKPFDRLLMPTADIAGKLHASNLHHRDLYLCHFFIKIDGDKIDVRLIDPARVKPLPGFLTRSRWIVKDLAQFWYSTTSLPITDEQRTAWLKRYGEQRGLASVIPLRARIERKAAWIARHDIQLRKRQPDRNVSIPVERAEG